MSEAKWFVVHTYSGYENKVKANIEKSIENRNLQEQILEVVVPLHDVTEVKNGVRKQVSKKMFPGYVLIKMDMNDETWYVVRNTRGVTGFVGPGSKPVPLSEAEIRAMGIRIEEVALDIEVDDIVKIIHGAFKGSVGKIKSINQHKRTATVTLNVFGRETPVELSFTEVEKM